MVPGFQWSVPILEDVKILLLQLQPAELVQLIDQNP